MSNENFFTRMSDRNFMSFLKKAYYGMAMKELKVIDKSAHIVISRRGLLDRLHEQGIILRAHRKIKIMSNKELVMYVVDNYKGLTLDELKETDHTVLRHLNERGLVDELDEKGIIVRSRRSQGALKYASDKELTDLAKREYKGLTIGDCEDKDPSLLNELRKRRLLDDLVEDEVIVRKNKPNGFFDRLTNKQLIDYATQYKGKSITEIEKNGEAALFVQLRKRDIVDRAVKEAGIIRRSRGHNPFADIKDKDFIKYIAENHRGHTLTEVCYEDKTAYRELKSRALDETLIAKGILIRKEKRAKNFFAKMSNEELIDYFRQNCQNLTLSSFQTEEGMAYYVAYKAVRNRGLVDKLVDMGVLIRKSYGRNKAPDPIDFIEDNEKATVIASLAGITDDVQSVAQLLVQMWPNRFPSASKLCKSLPGAIARIGKHLQPFTFQKASGLYNKIGNVPKRVYTALDDILFNIMVDQYQIPFNQNPQEALQEIGRFSRVRGPVSKLAKKVSNYYGEVYQFTIPGHGRMSEYRRGA
ncbi:MAG: hypothetical protein AABX96_00425 [Nanoarchaeota archaeon]